MDQTKTGSLDGTATRFKTFPDSRRLINTLGLFGIMLFGAGLRFFRLGEWSFWGDEVFTLSGKPDGFFPSISSMLIRAATQLLGSNELNARLVPALIGILTIPVLYYLTSRAFGQTVAWLSSALLAVSTWHIYWSQNARYYVLLLLFYTLALMLFYLGMERDRPVLLLLSLVFLGLAAVERLQALILFPVLGAFTALLPWLPFKKPPGFNRRNLIIFFAPCALIGIVIAGPFLTRLGDWMSGFGRVNNTPLWILTGFVYYVSIPVVCLGACAALYLLSQRDWRGLLFGLAAFVPPLAIAAISPFHYTANRYIFVSLTSWILLAGLGMAILVQNQKDASRILSLGVLLILFGTPLSENFLYFRYQNGNRENWRGAFEFIQQHQQEGDRVVLADIDLGAYYLNQRVFPLDSNVMDLVKIQDSRVWFIVDKPTQEIYPEFTSWIILNAQPMKNFDVTVHARIFVLDVYLYDPALSKPSGLP